MHQQTRKDVVITSSGDRFTLEEARQLAQLIYKRFGNNLKDATAAWRRMLKNSCREDQFYRLLQDQPIYHES